MFVVMQTEVTDSDLFVVSDDSVTKLSEGLYLELYEQRPGISLPSPSLDFNQLRRCKQPLITDQSLGEVTISIWVQVDSSSPSPPTLLPRGPACGLCNIVIGWFVGVGGDRGVSQSIVISQSAVFYALRIVVVSTVCDRVYNFNNIAKAGLCSKPSETLHLHYKSPFTPVCQNRDPAKGFK
ncbi:hypothetical protein LDENG_00291160 [Scomber scombrus]|uniref:Uncharacterized protein n=1 Tax=Scomber scombrus TaxID=13677 RepID=A0AAV1P917_SCOSC